MRLMPGARTIVSYLASQNRGEGCGNHGADGSRARLWITAAASAMPRGDYETVQAPDQRRETITRTVADAAGSACTAWRGPAGYRLPLGRSKPGSGKSEKGSGRRFVGRTKF
jgi:hypothetical protein